MNRAEQFAFRRIRSFRREEVGLYGVYVAVYSRVYRAVMIRRHRRGGHGRLMASGRCAWCGRLPPSPELVAQARWGWDCISRRYGSA